MDIPHAKEALKLVRVVNEGPYDVQIAEVAKRINHAIQSGQTLIPLYGIPINEHIRQVFQEKGYVFEYFPMGWSHREFINLSLSR